MNQPWLDEIVRRGSGEALVALTYDDGPGRYTPDLLDLLAGHGAKATFFLVGSQIEQYADVARRIVADGHEVGSHTMAHHNHKEVEPRVAVSDMLEGAAAIERVLG